MRPLSSCLLVLSFLVLSWLPASGADQAHTGRFLVITDIHFSPMEDPALFKQLATQPVEQWEKILESGKDHSFSQYGRDTNYALLKSSLDDARASLPDPDFIFFLGDSLAHKWQQRFAALAGPETQEKGAYEIFKTKAVRFIALQFHQRWPGVPLLATPGNNDSFCGDYMIAPDGPFPSLFAESWAAPQDRGDGTALAPTSSGPGHYTVQLPILPGHRLVVLNNIYWSARYENGCGGITQEPALDQLAWLKKSLAEARVAGEKVWLLMHMPMGIDSYASISSLTRGRHHHRPVSFYQDALSSGFARLAAEYGSTLQMAFCGHTHMDDFRLLRTGEAALLTKIVPSVCPIFGNNPSYQEFEYDRQSGTLINYQTHVLTNLADLKKTNPVDAPTWTKEYDFHTAYGLPDLTMESVARLAAGIATDTRIRSNYAAFYDTGGPQEIKDDQIDGYRCSITNTTPTQYLHCLEQAHGSR